MVAYVCEKLDDVKKINKRRFLKTSIRLLASLFSMLGLALRNSGESVKMSWHVFSNICPFHQSGTDSLLKMATVYRQQHKQS